MHISLISYVVPTLLLSDENNKKIRVGKIESGGQSGPSP